MTLVEFGTLDGAQFVRVREIGGVEYLQVWFGGTTVNVYRPVEYGLVEARCWSMSDEKGRPCEQEEIEEQMEQHFALIEAVREGGR